MRLCNSFVCVCVSSKSKLWNEWVMHYGTIQYVHDTECTGCADLTQVFIGLLLHFQLYANFVKP